MSILEGLKFYAGDTAIHKLDPRVKFLVSMLMLIIVVMYAEVWMLTILIAVQAAIVYVAKVMRRWLKTIKGSMPLAALVFGLNAIFFISTGTYTTLQEVFYHSLALAYRLVLFLSSFSIFFLTTTPEEIGLTLTSWHVPYQYTFAFISAIRFTPIIAQELRDIMDAQRARGVELDRGGPLQRARKFIPILVPLLANALRRAYELAEAMEVKCFGAAKKRTSLMELKARPKDYAVLLTALVFFGLAVYYRLFPF
ncbi:MAG: energy-coupling factor transporter transmembrane protein EcfT [Thaumarchaeota archaeon]|nr:energy-coupling factor transporter transmembrane protein EcfT [Candidatus Terraquivivens yellowstonensis]MCL7395409.1 energy-coupling factor transporter transmembrane protein EcfT [Candidatus Terraquivivens yellowstonensis]MCL7398015.1 energy-coupling factor transporter transmembrane protein EcfT [Candidatus Terraquivivens yellowstonensis]MCL7400333.1 energy-coupling factor transporter transmembrane protein EcfT [Candidatus Terraquivivens yellowstonensis]